MIMKKSLLIVFLVVISNYYHIYCNEWSILNDTPQFMGLAQLISIEEGKVLFFGTHLGAFNKSMWIFHSDSNKWEIKKIEQYPTINDLFKMSNLDSHLVFLYTFGHSWIFDYKNVKWTEIITDSIPTAFSRYSISRLDKNRILLFGGIRGTIELNETWIFNLLDSNWYQITCNNNPPPFYKTELCNISDGKVLLNAYNETWIFNESIMDWTKVNTENIPKTSNSHTLCAIGNKKAILILEKETWIFSEDNNQWTNIKSKVMPNGKKAIAALLDENQVLLQYHNETWSFNISELNWELVIRENLVTARNEFGLCNLDDNRIILFGGIINDKIGFQNDTWIYDLNTKEWTNASPKTKPPGRAGHVLCNIGNGKILMFGGYDGTKGQEYWEYFSLGDTWLYDVNENIWTQLKPKKSPNKRLHYGMSYISDNKAILFCGLYDKKDEWNSFIYMETSTWLFNLSDTSWTEIKTKDYPEPRELHSMSYIDDDKIILYGGVKCESVGTNGKRYNRYDDTWIFDLSDSNWNKINIELSPVSREGHSLCYLGNDNVLLFGGSVGTYNNETWIFNLKKSNWNKISTSNQPAPRFLHGSASLAGYRAVMFGGLHMTNDYWEFNSNPDSIPSIFTMSIDSISISSAITGGESIFDNGFPISGKGLVWSYNPYPKLNSNEISRMNFGSGSAPFRVKLENLYENQKYYVRAFAINEKGIVYGNNQNFQTLNPLSVLDGNQFQDNSISPNPATDYITISTSNKGFQSFATSDNVQIFDMLGIEVISESIHPMTSSHRMNVEKLPPGVYFIRIGDKVEKFVKL